MGTRLSSHVQTLHSTMTHSMSCDTKNCGWEKALIYGFIAVGTMFFLAQLWNNWDLPPQIEYVDRDVPGPTVYRDVPGPTVYKDKIIKGDDVPFVGHTTEIGPDGSKHCNISGITGDKWCSQWPTNKVPPQDIVEALARNPVPPGSLEPQAMLDRIAKANQDLGIGMVPPASESKFQSKWSKANQELGSVIELCVDVSVCCVLK